MINGPNGQNGVIRESPNAMNYCVSEPMAKMVQMASSGRRQTLPVLFQRFGEVPEDHLDHFGHGLRTHIRMPILAVHFDHFGHGRQTLLFQRFGTRTAGWKGIKIPYVLIDSAGDTGSPEVPLHQALWWFLNPI